MTPEEVVRNTMLMEMEGMNWGDPNQPISSLQDSINYFNTTYGPQGISYQEIQSRLADAYHYNGIPEEGYQPTAAPSSGLSAQDIAQKVAEHNVNKKAVEQAYQDGLITFQEKDDALKQSQQSLGQQKDQGLNNNSAYFSAVSPDAFQSQIGNYNQKVLDAYQQGQNTLQNDQAKLDYYKQNTINNYNDQMAQLNTFNAGTGQYGSNFSLSPVVAAPTLTGLDTGISKLSAGQVPQWAPNYGGLSTMQAKKEETNPLLKYMG